MARLILTRRAREQVAALPRAVQEAADEALLRIGASPREAGKQLRGRLRGTWAARVGGYRILYRIEGTADERVIVRSIGHRGEAYPPPRP